MPSVVIDVNEDITVEWYVDAKLVHSGKNEFIYTYYKPDESVDYLGWSEEYGDIVIQNGINLFKSYLLAALFNAGLTMSSYYRAEVNHDMPLYAG